MGFGYYITFLLYRCNPFVQDLVKNMVVGIVSLDPQWIGPMIGTNDPLCSHSLKIMWQRRLKIYA